jgi:hypothetical protein
LSYNTGAAASASTTVSASESSSPTQTGATGLPTSSSASSASTTTSATVSTTPSSVTGSPTQSSDIIITTGTPITTTTTKCQEIQAVDETTSQNIVVTPIDIIDAQKTSFQPTSTQGVSFPETETTPTITVTFGQPADVQSVKIPLHKTPGANVEQFEVTFYSPNGQKINDQPISSVPSAKGDKNQPAHLDSTQIPSNTPVSQLDIKVVKTSDNQSPKGVVLEINVCTESFTG